MSDSSGDGRSGTPPQRVADETTLDEFLAGHDEAMVMLYTSGCAICASMEPVVSNVARETGVPVVLVNPRDDPSLIERFDVRSVPKFVLFVDGAAVAELADGFVPGDDLAAWLESSLS